MTKDQLVEKGVSRDCIREEKIGVDEIANSGFDSIEDFLWDYSFYHNHIQGYRRTDVRYYVVSGHDKTIQMLVWLQKGE